MSNKSLPTIDEIVNVLKRTHLPTIIVEGTSDTYIYRELRKLCVSDPLITLICTGGRNSLFEVYRRRSDFSESKVVFIADSDSYRFDGVPNDYDGILFTNGYSIENDIYSGSACPDLLDDDDREKFDALRDSIGNWFAFELERHVERKDQGIESSIAVDKHINVVCPLGSTTMCPDFVKNSGYSEPAIKYKALVFEDYDSNVRGKQLFQILARFLSSKGRFSHFSVNNLIELAVKQNPSEGFLMLGTLLDEKMAEELDRCGGF